MKLSLKKEILWKHMVSSRKEKIGWQKKLLLNLVIGLSFISSNMMDNLNVKAIHNLFNSKRFSYFKSMLLISLLVKD